MTTNRKRTEECMNVNCSNSDPSHKRLKLSTKPVPSAASAVARLSRYPQVYAPLAREVHAPCRPTKFPLTARFRARGGDAMGNILIAKFEKAKSSALAKYRSVVEKGKEVIVVDEESDEPCADSSVEEPRGDGDKFRVQQQSQSTLSFDSELRNAELKVASRGKLWGSETQLDVESVHAYKKLLEDVGRRNGTFQRLNFEIDLNEKRRDHFNLLRPKKELDEVIMITSFAFTNRSSLCVWLFRCYFCNLVVVCFFVGCVFEVVVLYHNFVGIRMSFLFEFCFWLTDFFLHF